MKISSLLLAATLVMLPMSGAFAQAASTPSSFGPDAGKTLQPVERQFFTGLCASIQMQFKLAEKGGSRAGTYPNLDILKTVPKAMSDQVHATWDKLIALASTKNIDSKFIPQELSRSDESQMDKLDKVVDEKWHVEYFELLLKEVRQTMNRCSSNVNLFKDPDLKAIVTELITAYKFQIEQLEAARKEAKAYKLPKTKEKR